MHHKRILVPLNLEQNCLEALHFVSDLKNEFPVSTTLLHVVNLNVFPVDRRIYDEVVREREARLRGLAKRFFSGSSFPCVRVRVGKPHEEILAEAETEQMELIIMAGAKEARRRWRLWSSTTERVVRHAPCLTLVLPHSWKITPEQYREATRPRNAAPDSCFSVNYDAAF